MRLSPTPAGPVLLTVLLTVLQAGPLAAQLPIGPDDFRISAMGGSGAPEYRATYPAVAYNATDDEYLVVWEGDSNSGGLVDNQYQIFGQRIDGTTGALVGAELVISTTTFAPAFIPDYKPSVAWSSANNQYLVVWSGITGVCCEIDYELFARRLTATGTPLSAPQQISEMTDATDLNPAHYDAYDSAVVFNPDAGEFLVVWSGDDGRNGRLNDEFEIHGQRLDALIGSPLGADDFRISDAGGTGNSASHAYRPSVAYNPVDHEYLVVWWGEDLDAGTADGEYEIYGQRLDGSNAAELGANDFRISVVGPPGNVAWFATDPDVAHNPVNDEYLVVWSAIETVVGTFQGLEIFGQRLDATGLEIGGDDFRLTDAGGLGEAGFKADLPEVVFSPVSNRYLVSFRADDDQGGQVYGEREIHLQALDGATGAEVGPNDLRISDMGPNGDTGYVTIHPAIAVSSTDGGMLVVWQADDDSGGVVDGEYEIFGQRLSGGPLFADGFESADSSAWSSVVP
jgi:hypothetical protein